jgi:hypothetical protein
LCARACVCVCDVSFPAVCSTIQRRTQFTPPPPNRQTRVSAGPDRTDHR